MKRSADDAENRHLRVYSLDTGDEVAGVRWFDDETGEYAVAVKRGSGYVYDYATGDFLTEVRRGGIIVRSVMDPSFELVFADAVHG